MKREELLEQMDPFLPADFFSCYFSIHRNLEKVPSVSELLGEDPFASLSLAWSEEGIVGKLSSEKPFQDSFFPDYEKGDSLEIFIDTRDHKKGGFATRFCHHFLFLPTRVNSIQAQEITRFRLEDTHPLCSSSDLSVSSHLGKNTYELCFTIKAEALHGYDPLQFPRIGFAYILNRCKGKPQQFPISSERFDFLGAPSLWASVTLT